MTAARNIPRREFIRIVMDTLAVDQMAAIDLLLALDKAGYTVMPSTPTTALLHASIVAMRRSRHILPAQKDAAQRVKHEIRYRAMVERRREELGLADKSHDMKLTADRAIMGAVHAK